MSSNTIGTKKRNEDLYIGLFERYSFNKEIRGNIRLLHRLNVASCFDRNTYLRQISSISSNNNLTNIYINKDNKSYNKYFRKIFNRFLFSNEENRMKTIISESLNVFNKRYINNKHIKNDISTSYEAHSKHISFSNIKYLNQDYVFNKSVTKNNSLSLGFYNRMTSNLIRNHRLMYHNSATAFFSTRESSNRIKNNNYYTRKQKQLSRKEHVKKYNFDSKTLIKKNKNQCSKNELINMVNKIIQSESNTLSINKSDIQEFKETTITNQNNNFQKNSISSMKLNNSFHQSVFNISETVSRHIDKNISVEKDRRGLS